MQKSLVEVLEKQATKLQEQATFHFLVQGDVEGPVESMSLVQLCRAARDIGSMLVRQGAAQRPVLLLLEPGLEFVRAFFGCLYAGAIPVPAYPPEAGRPRRSLERLTGMVASCRTQHALVSSSLGQVVASPLRQLNLQVLQPSDAPPAPHFEPNPTEIALLQYTSGSTGSPRGVVLSHKNLLANLAQTQAAFGTNAHSRLVSWLPPYHDMGLIGGILHPIYIGAPVLSFSPFHFLQEPMRWLRAIHHFKASGSGGPNFAYDLVTKHRPECLEGLDLSTWSVAFNGAEPVKQTTLDGFSRAFASCGFRAEAFAPCYGLAEATLLVSTVTPGAVRPTTVAADAAALERGVLEPATAGNKTRTLVGCGSPSPDVEVAIVDPTSRLELEEGRIGEVWLRGPNVATEYRNNPEATRTTFGFHLRGTANWLATGDLGVSLNGQLFITGRLKDTIIVHGRNLYPQDIEHTVGACHPEIREGNVVVYQSGEDVVVVAETRRHTGPLDDLVAAIRRAVAVQHDVGPVHVNLVAKGNVVKTSSGKLARGATRRAVEERTLTILYSATVELQTNPESASVYVHLPETFRRLDARNSKYQFDLERDMPWHQMDAPGDYYGPELLQSYGYDLQGIRAVEGAWELLQWRTALSIACGFELLEQALLGFTGREQRHFLGIESIPLLEQEEHKHVALFQRYAAHLTGLHPELAPLVQRETDELRNQLLAFADSSRFPSVAAYHYCWWLLILFFEELTIWLAHELSRCSDIHPAWLCAHQLHAREETQHVLTDYAALSALQASDEDRLRWSELVFERMAPHLAVAMSPESALALVSREFPALANRGRQAVPVGSPFTRLLQSGAFSRTCAAGPYFAKVQKASSPATPSVLGDDPAHLERWIIDWVRQSAGLIVTSEQNFQSAGLDSVHTLGLTGALGRYAGEPLPGSLAYEHPTPSALARAVAGRLQRCQASPLPRQPSSLLARQRRLLHLDLANPGAVLDHVTAVFTLPVDDVPRVAGALQEIVRRHPQLWSKVIATGEHLDLVALELDTPLPLIHIDRPFDDALLGARAEVLDRRPFRLEVEPPWRAELWTSAERAALVLVVHHAVADAWSMEVLFGELAAGRASAPGGLPIETGLERENQLLQSAEVTHRLDYWRQQLSEHPDALRPSPPLPQHVSRIDAHLDAAAWAQVQNVARHLAATPYLVLLTAFSVAWSGHSERDDLLLNTHLFNRQTEAERRAVNYLVNLLTLRCHLPKRATFAEALEEVRSAWLQALEHDLPVDHLVQQLFPERYGGRWMPARVAFNLLLASSDEREGWTWRHDLAPTPQFLFFDAMFVALPTAARLQLTAWYDELAVTSADVARLMAGFVSILETLGAASHARDLTLQELTRGAFAEPAPLTRETFDGVATPPTAVRPS